MRAVAGKVPTPFYFYDGLVIKSRYRKLKSVLPKRWDIFFAAKANPNIAILGIYRQLGAYVETASAGEMKAAFKAGFKAGEMALSGPVKACTELSIIKKKRPAVIHAESLEELDALNRLGIKLNVALRVNPDFSPSGRGGAVIMVGGSEKFGFSTDDILSLLNRRGEYRNLHFAGFHMYIGTQIRSSRVWLKAANSFMKWVVSTRFSPEYLNFGGGLGIPYREGGKEFDLKIFKSGLKKLALRFDKHERFKKTKFFIEPGRYLAGPAGVYVMTVVAVKKIRGKNYLLTDGGIHHALFPYRVSKEYPVKLLNRTGSGRVSYTLGGPLCTTLDQGELPVTLPEVKAGDLLGIFQSGAYGYSASMQYFLSHPLPAETLWNNGSTMLIRKASEHDHLFVNQLKRKL